ncbi:MAG: PDZ domain-containing protein [Pyrinomonadaceae bacterium]
MYRKLFALALFFVFSIISISAQETPQSGKTYRAMILPGLSGSYLGVQTIDVTKENFSRFGLSEVRGVAIDKVLNDSPAEKAGLQNGDIIVRFDGETVSSVHKLTRLISEVAPDHKVNITVLRSGGERDIEITVGKREMNFDANLFRSEFPAIESLPTFQQNLRIPRTPSVPFPPMGSDENVFIWRTGASRQIGITLTGISKQLADYFGVADGKGLLISEVRADSPGAKAGIKAGDVIVEIEGKKVEQNLDLLKAINDKKDGSVSITVIRDRNKQTFSVVPEKFNEKNFVIPENEDKK